MGQRFALTHEDETRTEISDVLRDAFEALMRAADDHPWLAGVVAVAIVWRLFRGMRAALYGCLPRDPQRLFVGADRFAIMSRAGHRCEHHSWRTGRCETTGRLQADHVHPHSRGGTTTIGNGQALCGPHNERKGNRIPWAWELDRLARRRAAYFPSDASVTVQRSG
ncbi:HNH endonuclease [Trujillonella endophytica]|uniref:HNH endonuclease n=1 Tax=Trujillonella endophytica TaxID=673521 RepID=A0A1H8VVF8_9ACTN|nr:HNH endonuclease [Trujillella endophytica]SEP19217.1 HNH endonuclease [Trujillella endophytica]